jgi:hypothetical protein
MKGFALLALALSIDTAFLYSIARAPSRAEASAELAAQARRAAPDDEPRFVSVEKPIVVRVARF